MAFVETVFKKQAFLSHQKVVYHDSGSGYYLYNTGDKWVVRNKFFISLFFEFEFHVNLAHFSYYLTKFLS